MNGRFLPDTNTIIALFAQDASVQTHMAQAAQVFMPCIVAEELYFGACRSARVQENPRRLDAFVAQTVVLPCTTATAREYGRIKHSLREQGRPIPENDIWIAALAAKHPLVLVTRDAHFSAVAGLAVEAW